MQNLRRAKNHLEILRARKLRAHARRLRAEAHSLAQSARLAYFLAVKHYDSLVDTTATIQKKFGIVTIEEAKASVRRARSALD
ncbi:MAG TPA: hypothetical protein VFB76_05475 [Candidatus Angelobacter sp.]|nr:hypothetical protein [Candidatus Angelobacter sp.]